MKKELETILESLVTKRDSLKREMLTASPSQLLHSWGKWAESGEIQAQIDGLLEAVMVIGLADRFLRRKASISELRAAVRAAKGE